MEEEYYQGTVRGKINFVLYLLASVSLYFILKYTWTTYLPAPIEITDESVKFYSRNVSIAILCGGLFTFIFYSFISRFLYKYSIKIKKNKQFPIPNSTRAFRTKILKGEKAIKHAKNIAYLSYMVLFIGILKLGAGVYTAFVLFDIANTF